MIDSGAWADEDAIGRIIRSENSPGGRGGGVG